ncbi:hypothetical protein CLV24_11995 [Pontibacter ummariensis]|uniref:Uncharacterized protein n=1 Tax=Pontibacter ummariensis TaxID=1610492 RepID=A0A239J063_9BACT|nr:hypothetical protein [Pontibacter ummariensis]PRY09044.1 hypothetical protein CLV24_11995 [Pontibacter ummariensis]SNS99032.1 hypothetical protein SAMN06296052_11995 [Pontibacter ummariensis]
MAWSVFFGVVFTCYAIYYVLNMLFDLYRGRKQKKAPEQVVQYNLRELVEQEEKPKEVTDEPGSKAGPADQEEAEEPVLRVEGQGIPLEDFLRDAKSYSSSIF